ncbi:MAG: TIM barrel protein [Phycisphaerae bacterium]|nr:TIM barrel protein [Phycisphaerae bacterium]
MALQLSYHAITWGADTLGAIKDISDQGFRGIECFTWVADQYADNPALFKRVLQDHGLQLVALYGGGNMLRESREKDIEYNRRVAEFVAAVGGDRMMLGGGDRRRDKDGNDHFTDDDIKDLGETMNLIGEATLKVGVKACYHPHIGTIGEEKANVDRIFEVTDPQFLFAGPDPAHLLLGGYDPVDFFRRYADRIQYMHLKNVPSMYTAQNWQSELKRQESAKKGGDAATEVIPIFCELAEGQIDLPVIVSFLKERGYDGWVTTEIDGTRKESPRESARLNRVFWEGLGFSLAR